jgi:hypothetical protein
LRNEAQPPAAGPEDETHTLANPLVVGLSVERTVAAKPNGDAFRERNLSSTGYEYADQNGFVEFNIKAHKQPDLKGHGSKQCPQCRAEEKRATIYRWKVLVSLLVPNIMASMDLTIIATALPTIASHFGELRSIY